MAFYNGFYTPYQQYPQQYQQQQPQQSIQGTGFISVPRMEVAYNWPVAPGNSLMFKDDNAPYVYTKTRGFSQLDEPVFETYRLVKEDVAAQRQPQQAEPQKQADYSGDINALWEEIKLLKADIVELKAPEKKRRPKADEHAEPADPVK